jgi:hypothetical protein
MDVAKGQIVPTESLVIPPAPARGPKTRIPDFFIVGAPRCGTTALYTYLRQHPEVFMPELKEPDFFAEYLGPNRRIHSWPDYLALFEGLPEGKRIGEASPSYLASETAATAIKEFSPQASIIIMLRNPIELMHSMYHLRRFSNLEDLPTFEAALQADADGRQVLELSYRDRVRFAEQVERYLEVFGRKKVHFVIYDDFRKDTAAIYRDVLRFLEVRGDFNIEFPVINSSRRARNRFLWTLLRRPPMFVRRIIHPITTRRIRKSVGSFLFGLNTVLEPRPALDPRTKEMLRKELASEVERLSTLIGRDLTPWLRD